MIQQTSMIVLATIGASFSLFLLVVMASQRFALRQAEHDEAKSSIEATQAFEPDQLDETTTPDETSGDMETRLHQWISPTL